MSPNRKFKACLFDLDGLLLDSETVSRISYSDVLINTFNKQEGLTWDIQINMQGLSGVKAAQLVIDAYGLGGEITSDELYALTSKKQEALWPTVQVLPGVQKLLEYLHLKKIPICVCTSSTEEKLKLKIENHKELFNLFDGNIITGDNPTIAGKGKPLPFIWWLGLELLNKKYDIDVKPEECLIFEDAIPGFISGKRAGGYVIWVPHKNVINLVSDQEKENLMAPNKEHGIMLKSLEEFDPSKYGL